MVKYGDCVADLFKEDSDTRVEQKCTPEIDLLCPRNGRHVFKRWSSKAGVSWTGSENTHEAEKQCLLTLNGATAS
jgi:hypothetical protein